jgi:hypothetical protein
MDIDLVLKFEVGNDAQRADHQKWQQRRLIFLRDFCIERPLAVIFSSATSAVRHHYHFEALTLILFFKKSGKKTL